MTVASFGRMCIIHKQIPPSSFAWLKSLSALIRRQGNDGDCYTEGGGAYPGKGDEWIISLRIIFGTDPLFSYIVLFYFLQDMRVHTGKKGQLAE